MPIVHNQRQWDRFGGALRGDSPRGTQFVVRGGSVLANQADKDVEVAAGQSR